MLKLEWLETENLNRATAALNEVADRNAAVFAVTAVLEEKLVLGNTRNDADE